MQLLFEKTREVNLRNLSKGVLPKAEIPKGGKVLGELPDELRKLWVVLSDMSNLQEVSCQRVHSEIGQMLEQVKDEPKVDDQVLKLAREHELEHRRLDMVNKYFWFCVREEFPEMLFPETNITICQGWKVVSRDPKSDFLESLRDAIDEAISNK